jgi:two-component system cell cycle sensor histidine kinase/response regulator CckA
MLAPPAAYALAVAIPLAALGLQLAARELFVLTPFLLLSLSTPLVAWAAGPGPAVLTVLVATSFGYVFLRGSPNASQASGAFLAALTYLPVAALLGVLGGLVRAGVRDRHSSARALREREHLYRTLFDLAPYGVALVANDGRMVAFNAHAHEELGYTREEFEKIGIAELEAEEDQEEIRRHIEKIQATGADDFIGHHRTKSGQVRETRVQVRTVKIGDEILQLTTWRDETEERRARRELERNERRFRALIEKANDMIVLLDGVGRIRFWSPSSAEALGWTAEEVLGRDAREMTHPEDLARLEGVLMRVGSAPGATGVESLRLRHKDGSWRLVESRGRNLIDDPAVEGIVVNSRDVTEQRRLEHQLAESQKLESVGRLAGGVAHDFNNLLTVVLCCTDTMREDLAAGRAVNAEDVDNVRGAGERARDLTRQLLAFARRQIVSPDVIDLNETVRGSEKLLRRVLGEDVVLSTRLQPALWPVRCDPAQIEQVILNLAVNARDALPEGGHLLLDTANVKVGNEPPHPAMTAGDWVRLSVQDTGTGMTPEVKAHLFEPFFTTKPKGRGTGLGLATVYGIVQQSGGHIKAESDPAQGTTFDIYLPRSLAEVAARPDPVEDAVRRGIGTVLLVEDDAGVRAVASRALREGGYRVLAAAGAGEAMELAARAPGPVDILVTDVVMPGVNGKALAEELQRRCPSMRVLFVSGYAEDILGRHGVLEPGVEFLPKPFTPSALVSKVAAVVRGR